ncbi:FUSC family membrane protein [Arachidicoccus sp.]|uniref:FUSC family membrane protein n=1 Tax=Arachidicoccus sp. TaxID=1872624 RepID=UPI003D1FA092
MKLNSALPLLPSAKNLTEFKKFITSYNWYIGVKLAFAIMIPSIILYHYGLLIQYIMFPTGVLMLGLADGAGAVQRRAGALIIGIFVLSLIGIVAGLLREIFWVSILVLMLLGIICSLMSVYGARMTNIGTSGLILAIFYMDKHFVPDHILLNSFYMACGGFFYFLIFLISYKIKPFKLIEQMMGENIIETSELLQLRSRFYKKNIDEKQLLDKIMRAQVVLVDQHQNLREIVLKTRELTNETTLRSRMLLMMFLENINLYELINNSQQDYKQLHRAFDDTDILERFSRHISYLATELQHIGLAVQTGKKSKIDPDFEKKFQGCKDAFYRLRKEKMNAENLEQFIMLRQILYTIENLAEHIKKLHVATAFDKKLLVNFHPDDESLLLFLPKQSYDLHLFWSHLSLKSGMFRHAIRVAVAIMIGAIIGHSFGVGHAYWIMMTTVIVLKPAYSLARKKNFDRISGTIVGAIISFGIIYFTKNDTWLFVFLCIGTLISCTFSRINYFIYVIGITVMVVVVYGFINKNTMDTVLFQRLMNSLIGGFIGFLASYFILPNWESKLANGFMLEMIAANKKYFEAIMQVFTDASFDLTQLKLYRKNVFIALANLSDNFQRMLSDPKKKRQNLQNLLGLVAASHTISSYQVSLALYAEGIKIKYNKGDFSETAKLITHNFDVVLHSLQQKEDAENNAIKAHLPKNKKLAELLEGQRRLLNNAEGMDENATSIRKTITDYQTINGLFELINSTLCEEAKIVEKLINISP